MSIAKKGVSEDRVAACYRFSFSNTRIEHIFAQAHCAMTLGTIAGTVEALDIMRGKKDPPLHYFAGGVLGGFLAGGSVQLVQNHNPSVPFRFRPGVAVKSSVFFGLAGLGMGLVYNYLEPRFDLSSKTQAKSGSNSVNPGSEKRLDRKIYDALFPSEE